MKSNISITATLAVASLLGAARAHAEVKVGDHVVDLEAQTLKGKHFRLKDMAGKWVLVTFGASWCEPCHHELPAWDRVAPRLTGKMLFIAVDIDNQLEDGRRFVDTLKLKHVFPVLMPAESSTALKSYDPDRMPSTFVIDPTGVIRLVKYGYDAGDENALADQLLKLAQ